MKFLQTPLRVCQLHRDLLHDLDVKSLQRGYPSGVIRQQPDAFQVQV